MNNEADELQLTLNYGSSLDLQGSYSISNHILMQADVSTHISSDFEYSSFSGGLGYYNKFDERNGFEGIIGVGYGITDYEYSKIYFQPSYYLVSENTRFGIGTRVTMVEYFSEIIFSSLDDLYLEPNLTVNTGSEHIRFHTQIGLALPVIGPIDIWNPFIFNIGINVNLHPLRFIDQKRTKNRRTIE